MKRLAYFILSVFLAVSESTLATVEVRSIHFTSKDGLANNTVRKIFQDSKGFIWFATVDGLNRYDGNTFITFRPETRPDAQPTISIPDYRIYDINEDSHGMMWFQTEPEIYGCYNSQADCFVDYTGCGDHLQHYKHFMEDSRGNVWLWHLGNGLRRVTFSDGVFRSLAFKQAAGNSGSDQANVVYEDENGRVWVGFLGGIGYIDNDHVEMVDNKLNVFSIISCDGHLFFLTTDGAIYSIDSDNRVYCQEKISSPAGTQVYGAFRLDNKWIVTTTEGGFEFDLKICNLYKSTRLDVPKGVVSTDKKGNFWVYNHTGRMWYVDSDARDDSSKILEFRLIPKEMVSFIDDERYRAVKDSRGLLWITTYGNGLFVYDFETKELQHISASVDEDSDITTNFLHYVTTDRAGGIWVSSEYTGLTYISVLNRGAERILPEPNSVAYRDNTIRLLRTMPGGEILVGNRQGTVYVYDSSLTKILSEKKYPANVYDVAIGPEGDLWVATRGNGLFAEGKWYTPDPTDPDALGSEHIFALLRDSSDRMWIGTFGGGLNLAVKSSSGEYVFRKFLDSAYSQKQVRCLAEDNNGWIWVGTSAGLYVFSPETLMDNPAGGFVHYDYACGSLMNDLVKCLHLDSEGKLWLGTSGGFSVCDTSKGDYQNLKFKHFVVSDGLVNRMVQSIAEDNYGNLWISTEFGVSRFNPAQSSFENFFFSKYSLGNCYSDNTYCLTGDGKVLFGSGYGVVSISPEIASSGESAPPAVSFTNLLVNGNLVHPNDDDSPLKNSLTYSDAVRLRHYQNSFTVEFSSFNYDKTQATKYVYRLDKYDKTWSTPSALPFASYKNLSPGTYTLRVKACSSSGVWSSQETVLKVTVVPPFWKTTWAYIVYVLLFIAALYVTWILIRNFARLRNRIAIEKQLTEYKLVFFTNISHEFRTPLTLIQSALEKINQSRTDLRDISPSLRIMNKSTNRLLRLINQLLEFRKMQNNKLSLQLEETDIISFLYEIFLTFKDAAESKTMDFQFIPSVPKYKMFIDKGHVDKVVYNVLSNAFKYTPCKGKISLEVSVDEPSSRLILRVSDNGVGVPKEKQAQLFSRFMQSSFSSSSVGVGLHLSHELVTVHHGTISFSENEGGGSVFTVMLPTDKSVYDEADFLIPDNVLMQEEERHRQAVIEAEETFEEKSEELREKSEKLKSRRILVIEDDNDVRDFIKDELSNYFTVEVSADGNSALNKMKVQDFDLIVCDVMMPGLNGFEVTRKIKDDFSTSHIPVILLTALSSEINKVQGVESGADAYITKPFTTRLLLSSVFNLIDGREKLRQKFSSSPFNENLQVLTTEKDKKFAERLMEIVERQLGNPKFSVDDFAVEMGMGRTAFYKKVRGVTGYTPNEYVRIVRMKKAATLLLEGNFNVSEVAYMVGVNDPFYFSKCFKQQFGISPSAYLKLHK